MSCRKDTLQAPPETANKVLVKPEPPADLWERLEQIHQQLEIAANRHQIDWRWVKGHSDHPENDRVDELARNAIDRLLDTEKD